MDNLEFKKIHIVIIDFLKLENNYEIEKLEILGNWYFRFLISSEVKLNLHIPFYSVDFTLVAYRYVRCFTVLYNLLKQDKITQFDGTCLFDIFNKSSHANTNDLILDFQDKKEDLAIWKNDTITKLDAFLPVFNKAEVIDFNKPKTIKNTFELFKAIRNHKLIKFPLLIELEEKLLSFNNLDVLNYELISENILLLNTRLSRKEAIQIKKELTENYKNCISIKYPYSLKPTFPLTEIGSKKINIVFNNRFAHNDILENDIFLLKNENSLKTNLKYTIVDTGHSKELYDDFKSFREEWGSITLNKFTTPFPKYWLLFLNRSLTKGEWVEQFKKDFPAVAEKPIISTIEKIIEEVIGLNWIEKVITDKTKILFPDLKSNRKKRLEVVYNNFKKHVSSLYPNVKFIDSIDSYNYENVIVLDAFNIIDLVNKNDTTNGTEINITVPDFLYFGYQPWIKYHLLNYQYTPLINGLRSILDENHIPNKEELENLKAIVITEIKSDLKKYKNKYKEEIKENEEGNEYPSIEDIEFNNDEEIENAALENEIENNIEYIIINQKLETELTISSTEKVLLQRDYLLDIKAGSIQVGDFILRYSDIMELYKSNHFYDNFANIPKNVMEFQNELFKNKKVYEKLRKEGISYVDQKYFERTYVVETNGNNFKIPRRKNDWEIICNHLSIRKSDQQLTFIAYYGSSRRNELIKMYKSILNLLLENNWIGSIGNPEIVTAVAKIVDQFDFIFKDVKDFSSINEAESLINTILNQLTFTEILTIKTITNE